MWRSCCASMLRRAIRTQSGDFVSLLEEVRKPKAVKVDGLAGSYNATRGGPVSAAEVGKWTRARFQFAVYVLVLAENPLADVRNRGWEKPRRRVLTMEELRAV